jgi:hypothetical protein
MAKKHKDGEKKGKKGRARAEPAAAPAQNPEIGRTGDMRRIAREAAWSRMFGATGKNPFTQQT